MLAFFATVSSLAILDSCRSLLPRSFSSSRVSFAVWLVLRSLSGLLCSFGLVPFSFWIGRSFHLSRVFLLLVLGFSVAIPRSFLSCAFAFLSSSRMLLLGRGFGYPVLTSFMYFLLLCLFRSPTVLSSLPVSGSLPRPTFISLVSFLFFSCLVLLFCALPSGPPGVSLVPTSS